MLWWKSYFETAQEDLRKREGLTWSLLERVSCLTEPETEETDLEQQMKGYYDVSSKAKETLGRSDLGSAVNQKFWGKSKPPEHEQK